MAIEENKDLDKVETNEWLEAFNEVIKIGGKDRAKFILNKLIDIAHKSDMSLPSGINTAYVNTIFVDKEVHDLEEIDLVLEERIQSINRWNALVMILLANKDSSELGGHIASYASSAVLYEVGFNHFYRGNKSDQGGDLVFFQGHSAPGIYARSYLEGRITEQQLKNFRQEIDKDGLSSYPHPYLMSNFWQFPTVSMGLSPLMAIYQARFMKYLEHRNLIQTNKRVVWAYLGDGEMDEPESLGAISVAGREKLDNLIFIINCNLQRLDGPVRGNGKIIQELEACFRGANWNVIKVIWGSKWDELFAKDKSNLLQKRMEEVVDGEYQAYKSKDGAYVRNHFFGKYPELLELVSDMTDEQIYNLNRGGHDIVKVFNAYHQAKKHKDQPTVILAKTIKGYGLGEAGEGQNVAHQQKKVGIEVLKKFKKRFDIEVSDENGNYLKFYKPDNNSLEIKYLKTKREKLGGYLPERLSNTEPVELPELSYFDSILQGSNGRKISTTMCFVRILSLLVRDKKIGQRIVPIVPDEARTFGMEGLFRQLGIYSSSGQLYQPEDSDKIMWYREDISGQILQEGINEAGAFCDWIAAATSYSVHQFPMIAFYAYYSIFGFQRIGDLAWAAADMQAKGFLMGGTAGRTTLAGEGLQHQDGSSLLLASTIPNCVSYDPTYGYELAVIIQDGLKKMYQENKKCYYYITMMNENYEHHKMPEVEGIVKDIISGMYNIKNIGNIKNNKKVVHLLGSGAILREVQHAAQMLLDDWGISSKVWSVTSFNELAREGNNVYRDNLLSKNKEQEVPYVTKCLSTLKAPVIAATDYVKSYCEQIRKYIPFSYETLGTDGFGRSDNRANLRYFFEVDRYYIVLHSIKSLVEQKVLKFDTINEVFKKYKINLNKKNPFYN